MTSAPPTVAVIVVAAGSGTRLGAGIPKAFVMLEGRTLLERALHSISGMHSMPQLIVVAPGDRLDEAQTIADRVTDGATTVAGGFTRQQSVEAGLDALADSVRIVLVHDAARPLTPSTQFDRIVETVERTGAGAIPGLPVSDTIKRVDQDGTISETVDRSALAAVQTPQGFPRDHLVAAYRRASEDVTDDAALLAAAGHPVSVVEGDARAFKITTEWDLRRAEDLVAGHAPATRVGIGADSHAFGGDRELWVACLSWPEEPGLAGHSDGDPVAHAITDALLAAAGLGDIGSVFGTSDERFAGAHGDVFLRKARILLEAEGFRVGNVSVQLIGNRPRFSARRSEAEHLVAEVLGAPVSISATTTDGLGFTGRGEGIAAIATALIIEHHRSSAPEPRP